MSLFLDLKRSLDLMERSLKKGSRKFTLGWDWLELKSEYSGIRLLSRFECT